MALILIPLVSHHTYRSYISEKEVLKRLEKVVNGSSKISNHPVFVTSYVLMVVEPPPDSFIIDFKYMCCTPFFPTNIMINRCICLSAHRIRQYTVKTEGGQ